MNTLPKRNTKFKLEDYFQIDVDDFHNGNFLFLSAQKVKTKINEDLTNRIESYDEYGWIISTYCYDYSIYHKIFICEHKLNPWQNHYHAEMELACANNCDGYAVNNSLSDFIEWMATF